MNPILRRLIMFLAVGFACSVLSAHAFASPEEKYQKILIADRYLYAAGEKSISILDITSSTNPNKIGLIQVGARINDLAVSGKDLYVIDSFLDTLHPERTPTCHFSIFDISNPSLPKLLSCHEKPEYGFKSLKVNGRYAYLTYWNASSFEADVSLSGIQIFDVSDHQAPLPLGKLEWFGSSSDLAVRGPRLYLAKSRTDSTTDEWRPYEVHSVQILDVGDPNRIRILSNRDSAPNTMLGRIELIQENMLIVSSSENGGGFIMLDVHDPTSTTLKNEITHVGGASALTLNNSFLFIGSDFIEKEHWPGGLQARRVCWRST